MSHRNLSYAQNGEDIVLWRALGDIEHGIYIDVGANHPSYYSVTRKFYDAGWRGLAIEPNPEYARLFEQERPEDTLIEAVITDQEATTVPFHLIEGTGLSTLVDEVSDRHREAGYSVRKIDVPAITLNAAIERAGLAGRDIHFMVVDTEGAEARVLASIDLERHRPWVLVIEATEPLSTEQVHGRWEQRLLDARYRFCLFDGLSRVYAAEEHADRLGPLLSYSAGVLDDYVKVEDLERVEEIAALREERDRLVRELHDATAELVRELHDATAELARVREEADGAHAAVRRLQDEVDQWQRRVDAMEHTLSWRITAPVRAVRRLGRG